MAASISPNLLQAHVELWNLTLSYLKSSALQCAVELGIPNAIHRHGGAASLPDLLATITIPESKRPYLPRLMRFLAATGILARDDAPNNTGEGMYSLTPLSRLLVDDTHVNGCTSLAPFVLSQTLKHSVAAVMHLSKWFKGENGVSSPPIPTEMPFVMAHGMDFWEAMGRDLKINNIFNAGMGSESHLVLEFVVSNCGEVFDGISSLIDVGGGNGSAARAIARAFPHVKCSVLDLPNVIRGIQPAVDDVVKYIAGDMMDSIPQADAVLLKFVLHDWNDADCVKILTQCRKAIGLGKPSGAKVIIIETVVGSPSKDIFETQVSLDLLMMALTSGKEREEHEWCKIFMDAGFKHYKISPVLGFLSIIELYPKLEA